MNWLTYQVFQWPINPETPVVTARYPAKIVLISTKIRTLPAVVGSTTASPAHVAESALHKLSFWLDTKKTPGWVFIFQNNIPLEPWVFGPIGTFFQTVGVSEPGTVGSADVLNHSCAIMMIKSPQSCYPDIWLTLNCNWNPSWKQSAVLWHLPSCPSKSGTSQILSVCVSGWAGCCW